MGTFEGAFVSEEPVKTSIAMMKSTLVLVAFSLLVMRASCETCPEINVDYWGCDYGGIDGVASWNDCGQMCELINDCKFWTYVPRHGRDKVGRCEPKKCSGGYKIVNGHISGERGCK